MKNKKRVVKKVCKIILKVTAVAIMLILLNTITTNATSLEQSKLVTGTRELVDAIIKWMMGISITVCGGYFIYYVYCLKSNDEHERRRNIQNIKTTLISMVLITCGIALIDVILGFYK